MLLSQSQELFFANFFRYASVLLCHPMSKQNTSPKTNPKQLAEVLRFQQQLNQIPTKNNVTFGICFIQDLKNRDI